MDKLVEREPATRDPLVAAPALAVQFFLIPLAVVGVTVLVYVGFRSLLTDERSAAGLPGRDPTGGTTRRWPAAYELSRLMADPSVRANQARSAPRWSKAFDEAKDDDPRVRQYLALALGRLDPPLPDRGGAPTLGDEARSTVDPDGERRRISAIWALGSSGDAARRAGAAAAVCVERRRHPQDGGVRARRAARRRADRRRCATALRGCGARRALERRRRAGPARQREGVPVLRQMLDRAYVEQTVKRDVAAGRRLGSGRRRDDQRPAGGRGAEGREPAAAVEALSQQDRSMKVRQAALEALKVMG